MSTTGYRAQARLKRKKRIRKRLTGTSERPRMSVFRSSRHIYAQVIDDGSGHTIAAASSLETEAKGNKDIEDSVSMANFVGKLVGERAKKQGIKQVVFDRNGFLYHGRVKAVSEGARKAGLEF